MPRVPRCSRDFTRCVRRCARRAPPATRWQAPSRLPPPDPVVPLPAAEAGGSVMHHLAYGASETAPPGHGVALCAWPFVLYTFQREPLFKTSGLESLRHRPTCAFSDLPNKAGDAAEAPAEIRGRGRHRDGRCGAFGTSAPSTCHLHVSPTSPGTPAPLSGRERERKHSELLLLLCFMAWTISFLMEGRCFVVTDCFQNVNDGGYLHVDQSENPTWMSSTCVLFAWCVICHIHLSPSREFFRRRHLGHGI